MSKMVGGLSLTEDDVSIRTPQDLILLLFYESLGPAVHKLQYWGNKLVTKHHKKKLDSFNQLFLTLIKGLI